MALDLQGLDNSTEFFSHHYLSALLESDLKGTAKRWREAEKAGGPKAPWKRLDRIATPYFPLRARAAEAPAHDVSDRLDAAREVHARLLDALGIPRAPGHVVLDDGKIVPVLAELRQSSRPWLWVVEAPFPVLDGDDSDDPLSAAPLAAQLPAADRDDLQPKLATDDWRTLLDRTLFAQEHAPRFVLVLSGSALTLADRHRWGQGRHLSVDLDVLFTRRSRSTLKAVCGLFHREVLAPDAGGTALDALIESSHKQAVSVSGDLRHGAREAVELLANEAIFYKRTVAKQRLFERDDIADTLTRECLTWLYRLLFLFYVEARGGELGVVPMNSEAYRLGYSLDSLRDLALRPLTTPQAQSGHFLHHSLTRLFSLINRGWPLDHAPSLLGMGLGEADRGDFRLRGVRSELFDDDHTPFLRGVKVRNHVWQRIIELLSLTPEGKGARQRVSYALLGINQLGSVYEGLLSYSGFFAKDDLIEVKAKKDMGDPDARTFYVPHAHAALYDPDEIVKETGDKWKVHPKGTFLFRLAGRDREKSASYYTPEVLTRCLTKYTLAERLENVPADDILGLTVCEPAMGSGAFLIEAVDQLAAAYLDRKQQERREAGDPDWQLDPADYAAEKRKVAASIALHNAYGVDLNPLAGELARLSLWLGSLREDAPAPWFGARLATGNSLVGARLQWYAGPLLRHKPKKSGPDSWQDAAPDSGPRPGKGVYHFLVFEPDMAPYDKDKVVKGLPGIAEKVAELKAWKKAQKAPYTSKQTARLAAMSDRVDALLQRHAEARRRLLDGIRQAIPLWGQPAPEGRALSAEECIERLNDHQRRDWSARKLRWAMDYHVALWFWPVEHAGKLPSRAELLGDLEFILDGETDPADLLSGKTTVVADLDELVGPANPDALSLFTVKGELGGTAGRLEVVRQVAERVRPLHWVLEFPEVFVSGPGAEAPGGFDVVLGNPPWVKVQWNEGGILGDLDPRLELRRMSAKQKADERLRVLSVEKVGNREAYLAEFEEMVGLGNYLGSHANQPLLKGQQTNLYKCFITKAWELLAREGMSGLIHQQGIFDDPKGGTFRRCLYPRLRLCARFQNQLKLFETVQNERPYVFTVSAGEARSHARFRSISNLLHPDTLDLSLCHDGRGEVPGIKSGDGAWDLRGHSSRVVIVDEPSLKVFALLFDASGTAFLEARLPVIHSTEIGSVLRKLSESPVIGSAGDRWQTTREWHEGDRTSDNTIVRRDRPSTTLREWMVSGPHFFVGNPYNKEPNAGCRHNKDYRVLDADLLAAEFLPRSVYSSGVDSDEYERRMPRWKERPIFDYYRHCHRQMIAPTGERSMVPAILPAGPTSVETVFTAAFSSLSTLVSVSAACSSIPVDFLVKSTGRGSVRSAEFSQLPCPTASPAAIARTLRLNCLTTHYAPLWSELFDPAWAHDTFTKPDPRLPDWTHLTAEWQRNTPLRTPYARRQALVELDALAALALGLTADELCLIYRVQFPVLQGYERETFYDQRGRIVFTVNRGLNGVGLKRKEWQEIQDAQADAPLPDWAHDALGPYVPPFDACDREADMRQAYAEFQRRQAAEDAS
jgi:hypothetical protein